MRHVTQTGLELIKQFESFSSRIYICPSGYPTIGYGHVVREYERKIFADGITAQEGELLLLQDTKIAEAAVCRFITVPLTDGQFDSLVSFTFNLGSGALQRSTLRWKVNCEEHEDVPVEFMKWVWSGGRKVKGLINRRKTESNYYSDTR